MRTHSYVLLLMVVCLLISAAAGSQCRAGQLSVVRVYNGAEARLSDGRKIRYSGISVPEKKNMPFFQESLEAHQRLVQGKPITLLVQPEEQAKEHKRVPVVAFYGTQLVNAELIRQGWALAAPVSDDFRYRDLFRELQQEARQESRGLWAWRDTFSEPYYIGSRSRRVFHRPDCSNAKNIPFEDRVIARTSEEAFSEGYVQHWRCSPLFRVPAAAE